MTRRLRLPTLFLSALLLGAGFGPVAHRHALEPGYLELREIDEGLYAVVWKKPATAGVPTALAVSLPEQCDPRTEGQLTWDGSAFYARWTARCAGGLEGGARTRKNFGARTVMQ